MNYKKRFNGVDKYKDKPRSYKQNGEFIEFGSVDDVIARLEWQHYKHLAEIIHYSPWDGENWVKPECIDQIQNPLEIGSYLDSSEIKAQLVERKWVLQSDDEYWRQALEYQKHLENGGADLAVQNSKVSWVEWIEDPEAKPINVLINKETGEAFQVPASI